MGKMLVVYGSIKLLLQRAFVSFFQLYGSGSTEDGDCE